MTVGILTKGVMQEPIEHRTAEPRGKDSAAPAPARGRPRDPLIEARIFEAALTLYGRQGWLGFNLDAVARGARVSKDAMYRRWKSRETLLRDALHQRWDWITLIDQGDVRLDLLELGQRTFETFAGPYGEVALRLRADARSFAEVREFAEPYRALLVLRGRAIVRKAVQRGDLPPATNPGVIMDLLIGGIVNHIISTPGSLRQAMLDNGPEFVRVMVEIILAGARQTLQDRTKASQTARGDEPPPE